MATTAFTSSIICSIGRISTMRSMGLQRVRLSTTTLVRTETRLRQTDIRFYNNTFVQAIGNSGNIHFKSNINTSAVQVYNNV